MQVPGSWSRCLLPGLVSLALTRNQLRSVDALGAGSWCSRLQTLDVSNNVIDVLPRHFGRSMPRLTTLLLTGTLQVLTGMVVSRGISAGVFPNVVQDKKTLKKLENVSEIIQLFIVASHTWRAIWIIHGKCHIDSTCGFYM